MKKPRVPLLVKDVHRMRDQLTISALGRVRLILQAEDQKLGVLFECYCCEELLEWVGQREWWICPVCGDQTTEKEAEGLLITCSEGLKRILGEATDTDTDTDTVDEDEAKGSDEGPRGGRWLDRLLSLMGS